LSVVNHRLGGLVEAVMLDVADYTNNAARNGIAHIDNQAAIQWILVGKDGPCQRLADHKAAR